MTKIRCVICGHEAVADLPKPEVIAAELTELLGVDIDPGSIIMDVGPLTCPECTAKRLAAPSTKLIH